MMPQPNIITSTANPAIKHLRALQEKNRLRRQEKSIIVEGKKEIELAQQAAFQLRELFICPELTATSHPHATYIRRDVFEKIAYRDSRDGLIAVFEEPVRQLDNLTLSDNPFLVIVEGVEKPGNLGAIIRTADGAGADAVIVTDERCDVWNPNVIRASVGTIFTTHTISCSNEAALAFLDQHQIRPFAAEVTPEAQLYTTQNYRLPTAIIVGAEATAVSEFWLHHATTITLPMNGVNSSLNVSAAAAVLLYEVVRQRG